MGTLISVKDLSFTYGGESSPVFSGVSFDIKEGELVFLYGGTGCGKTTLFKLIKGGLISSGKMTGSILFDGRVVQGGDNSGSDAKDERDLQSEIGYVFQRPEEQMVTDKVWHELAFGLENMGMGENTMRLRVAETAEFFGIGGWFEREVASLSGGQKQILALASVMVMNPKLLILDEPISALDPIAAGRFVDMLIKLNRELGITVLVTEHRPGEFMPIADRILYLRDSRLDDMGSPGEFASYMRKEKDERSAGLPLPMRLFIECEKTTSFCPLNVREARRWLDEEILPEKGGPFTDRSGQEAVSETVGVKQKEKQSGKGKNSEDSRDTVISCRDLFFRYDKKDKDILKGLSLDVRKGEIFALMGGNASGKSTLVSVLAGLECTDAGSIHIKGKDIRRYSRKELYGSIISVMPQDVQTLFVKMSVREELSSVIRGEYEGVDKNDIISGLAGLTGITHLLDRHPYDLSGGEQKLLALAMVLGRRPEILFLDEPTGGMGAAQKKMLGKALKELKDTDVTVFMVSHDTEFCSEYADRCALMFNGEITAVSDTRSFFGENNIFTTQARRISRGYADGAVTSEDILSLIGG